MTSVLDRSDIDHLANHWRHGVMSVIVDHDGGDEDRSGSVQCYCNPWCGLPICDGCTEDHGGHDHGDVRLCRDCDLDWMFAQMTCTGCGKMRLSDLGVAFYGDEAKCVCPAPKPPTQRWQPS